MQAIKAATVMSALTCGVDDKARQLSRSVRIADLIVVAADPLENIEQHAALLQMVFKDGAPGR